PVVNRRRDLDRRRRRFRHGGEATHALRDLVLQVLADRGWRRDLFGFRSLLRRSLRSRSRSLLGRLRGRPRFGRGRRRRRLRRRSGLRSRVRRRSLGGAMLGRGQALDDPVLHEAGQKSQRLHLSEAEVLGDRGDIALAIYGKERPPAVGRERDRALIGGLLGEPEAHPVVGYRLANRRDPIARLGSPLQERDKISGFEVCFGRRFPWRELEVGLRDRKDSAEGVLASLAIHYRRDEASTSKAEGTDLGVASYLELPCLRSACEETDD